MEINETLLHDLRDMEKHELNRIIEDDYYRQVIACDADDKSVNAVIDTIITDVMVIERASASIDRFDLADYCLKKCEELVQQISLKSLLN
jgi:hypothetical protein